MADSHTVVTRTSYASRIGGGLKNIIFGFVFLVIGVVLLWWNEGRTVKQHRALNEVQGQVQTVSVEEIQIENEGVLVYTNGTVVTVEGTKDEEFSVSSKGLALKRKVEMYQWNEDKKSSTTNNVGGSQTTETTYTYDAKWSSRAIDSSRFDKPEGHGNPNMSYKSQDYYAQDAQFGAFAFTSDQVRSVTSGTQSMNLQPAALEGFPAELTAKGKLTGGWFYSADAASPAVGDYRIKFYESPASVDASVIAQQQGQSLVPYEASNGNKIQLIKSGTHSADAMVESAQKTNTIIAWVLRILGIGMLMLSFGMIFSLFSILASVIPILGRLAGGLSGFLAGLLGFALGFVIIAAAWIAYRPVLGVSLLAVAALVIVLVVFKSSNNGPVIEAPKPIPPTPSTPQSGAVITPSTPTTNTTALTSPTTPMSGGLTFNIPQNTVSAGPVNPTTTSAPTATHLPTAASVAIPPSPQPVPPQGSTASNEAPISTIPPQAGTTIPAPWDQK